MLLSDGEIQELIEQDVLVNADKDNVGTVTCNLRTKRFVFSDGSGRTDCELQHSDSTFVECVEGVQLPNTIAAAYCSRTRTFVKASLDAPLCFPGHKTVVYYRRYAKTPLILSPHPSHTGHLSVSSSHKMRFSVRRDCQTALFREPSRRLRR